jgi:pimeloyl-ACP methyl ester carboxylesterase
MTNPEYSYDGLVVTSIDYKSEPTEDRPNRITFTGYTPGNEAKRLSGDELKKHNEERKDAATFLWKCKHIGGADKDGKREYEADKLTNEEAHTEFVKRYGEGCKPLFSIHGFNNEPGYTFRESTKAQQKFDDGKNAIIPVVWPNYGGPAYDTDRSDNAPEASKELNMLVQHILGTTGNLFKNKNLICHSMGNYVLRGAANPNIKFDNIFMVAAVSFVCDLSDSFLFVKFLLFQLRLMESSFLPQKLTLIFHPPAFYTL